MQNFLHHISDIIFPPSEDMLRVRKITTRDIPSFLSIQRHPNCITLSNYSDPNMRAIIHEAKFHLSSKATSLLGLMIDLYIQSSDMKFDIVIPLPLSRTRRHERGYNQVEEILHASVRAKEIGINQKVLLRNRNTPPQTTLGKTERLTNMRNAFGVKNESRITDKDVLLVDDVYTTGATLREAKKELEKHKPASITCIAIAH